MKTHNVSAHGIVVRDIRVLYGPNLYAYMPVLQIKLDIGPYEEQPGNNSPGVVERRLAWLPGVHKHE